MYGCYKEKLHVYHPWELKSYLHHLDQYQYLGNCPPTPPLNQRRSIDNKLGWMLG